jgi:hypothetical protein
MLNLNRKLNQKNQKFRQIYGNIEPNFINVKLS